MHNFSSVIILVTEYDLNVYHNLRHAITLQPAACTSLPLHGNPPSLGAGLLHIRLLIIFPVPQVVLHLP